MSVSADDGSTHQYTLEKLYLSAVTPATNTQLLVGEYSHNGGYGSIQTANTLTLKADGSYSRLGVGSYKADDGGRYGGSSDDTGTWQYANHTLTFRGKDGSVKQQIALLAPKGSLFEALGYLFVGGKLYRQKK